jgi:hypothetical protein
MSMVGPLGGARAGDLGAPIINAKKHRRRAPWEVPQLEIFDTSSVTVAATVPEQ